jgi:hypothetical protein
MSGTATTQLRIGMTHQLVWSTQMIELVVVVTARLHAHPHQGRDEGMPPAPDTRAARPRKLEDRSQVDRAHPTPTTCAAARERGKQGPARGAGARTIIHLRASPPPASRPSPPGGLRPALTPAQRDQQETTDPVCQRRAHASTLLCRAPIPGLRPGPTSPEPNSPVDGSTLHRYADRCAAWTARRRRSVVAFGAAFFLRAVTLRRWARATAGR